MSKNYQKAVDIFDGSSHYCDFLKSLSCSREKIQIDTEKSLSVALYYHLFKIQVGGWEYKVKTGRSKRHPLSEITQDLISYYIKAALPDEYSVLLEASVDNKTYVDIGIKHNNKYCFMIEVKTTIGYQRDAIILNEDGLSKFCQRRDMIAEKFGVDKNNVIFLFLSEGNVSREFSAQYWDVKNNVAIEIMARNKKPPYSYIFPLFHSTDPYYFRGMNLEKIRNYNDTEIYRIAESNIVTPLEHIVDLITNI